MIFRRIFAYNHITGSSPGCFFPQKHHRSFLFPITMKEETESGGLAVMTEGDGFV